MGSSKKSPAIFAGLIGIGAFGIPVPSYAFELPFGMHVDLPASFEVPFTFEDFAGSPAVYFVLGCLAGACVSGLIVFIVQKHAQKLLRERFARELNEARAEARNAAERSVESPAAEEPVQPGTTQATTPLTFKNPYSTYGGSVADTPAASAFPTLREIDASSPFASARLDAVLPHVTDAVFSTPQSGDSQDGESAPVRTDEGASLSAIEGESSSQPVAPRQAASNVTGAVAPSSQTTHTSEITSTYAEREANRKRGVFSLLSERLGSNMMSDIPVIERADGTVADIGARWWTDTMGSTMTQLTATNDAAKLGMRPADETTDLEAAATISANAQRRARARTLAERLPNFEAAAPLYPDSNDALPEPSRDTEDDSGDLFEEAMRNMDDELPNPGITTSVDAMPTGVVPPEALGNFQNGRASAPVADDVVPTDDPERSLREDVEQFRADEHEMRRRSWHVVDGGAAANAAPSTDAPAQVHSSYRPKHMRRKQA